MANSYCQQSDLEVALGGANVLLQLSDFNRDGQPDTNVVTDYLESGAAELRSAVEIKHDPETIANFDTASLRRLIDANAALSARIAYEKGGRGVAMPDWVRDRAERADKFADDLAKGFRRLGRIANNGKTAALSQPVGTVDQDPNGDGGTFNDGSPAGRVSITGFMKGFR